MIKQYFKQAWFSIRSNPLISTISTAGTALSIAMIMVVILTYQIKLTDFAPESNRSRMLYVQGVRVEKEGNSNGGGMSAEAVKECFYSLQIPEAVTAGMSSYPMGFPVSLPEKRMFKEYPVGLVDANYWKVFNYHFLKGTPFTEADFNSRICNTVVSDYLARNLFGTTDVVGREIVINSQNYKVCGVVKAVSKAATDAYAEVWIPYSTNDDAISSRYLGGMAGPLMVCMTAYKRSDFALIKEELEKNTAKYNDGKEFTISFMKNPITRIDRMMGSHGFLYVELKDFLTSFGALLLFLLLIPTLNLIGVTQSSVQQRKSEVGIRKAFGATNNKLLMQVLYENLVVSLIGGAIGFVLSFVLLLLCKDFLIDNDVSLTFEMLFKPLTFLIALFFVLLLNGEDLRNYVNNMGIVSTELSVRMKQDKTEEEMTVFL